MENINEDLKEVSEAFGDFIKQKRKEKGLTLVELAKKSGLSHSYLSQLENCKRNLPPMSTQIKICRSLGASIMELPTTEDYYYSYEELDRFQNEVIYEEIAKDIRILSKDANNFRDEVIGDPSFKRAIQNFVNKAGYTDYKVTPSGLLEELYKADGEWNYLDEVIEQIADLVKRFSKYNQYVTVETGEILEFMDRPSIKFNGHALSTEEKERIVAMIKLMFPDKVDKR